MKILIPAVALTALLLALPAQAQKSVNLQARTAGDLADLCAASPKEALGDAKKYGNLPVPLKIRNAPTKLMKNLGYGEGYQKYTKEDLLPEKLKGKKYWKKNKEG